MPAVRPFRRLPLAVLILVAPLLAAACTANPNGVAGQPAPLGDACSSLGWGKIAGGALGGVAGGLLASNLVHGNGSGAATAVGVIGGILLGSAAGSRVDDVDCMKARQAQAAALSPQTPIGRTITWNDPKSGATGTFTPTRDGQAAGGEYCREYQQTIIIGGEQKQGFGTACRQPDGTWKVVNQG